MKNFERNVKLILISILFIVVIPYINSILYALPSTDDFWMAAGVDKTTIFIDSIDKANWFYQNWGGLWLYEFLRVLLNPLVWFGATSKWYGIEMVLFFLVFLLSLWIVNFVFWKKIIKDEKGIYTLGSYVLILVWFLNTEIWTEVFFWFVGAAYMWALSMILMTVALIILYFDKTTVWRGILLSVVGAISCSFYSQAFFPCVVFIILFLKDAYRNRKIQWLKIFPFFFFLLGALTSLIAPGNYVRNDATGGFGLISTVKNTLIMCFTGIFYLFENPITIVCVVIFLGIGMLALGKGKLEYRYPVIPFIITFMCLVVACFPFALGYGELLYIPNRMMFAFNMFAIVMLAYSFMYLGGWIRYKKNVILTSPKLSYGLLYLLAFAYIALVPTKYYEEIPYALVVAKTGQIEWANEQWRGILNYLDSFNEGEEVCFSRAEIITPVIKSPGITADSEHSINRNIAEYYGLESINIIWLELED